MCVCVWGWEGGTGEVVLKAIMVVKRYFLLSCGPKPPVSRLEGRGPTQHLCSLSLKFGS